MDLQTIKEELIGGNYDSPAAFIKDMRLIFTNSRNYNTNKRSAVSTITITITIQSMAKSFIPQPILSFPKSAPLK